MVVVRITCMLGLDTCLLGGVRYARMELLAQLRLEVLVVLNRGALYFFAFIKRCPSLGVIKRPICRCVRYGMDEMSHELLFPNPAIAY